MIVKAGDVIRSYDFKPMLGREDFFVPVAVAYNDYPGRVMNLSRV